MFSAKDIAQIIKACKSSGVLSLEIGELKISFLDKCDKINQNLDSNSKILDPLEPGQTEDIKYETLSEDEKKEMLMFSDPDKWERQVIAEETQEAFYIGAKPTL